MHLIRDDLPETAQAALLRWHRRRRALEQLLRDWERDGYVIVRGLLTPAECARLEEAVPFWSGSQKVVTESLLDLHTQGELLLLVIADSRLPSASIGYRKMHSINS